MPSDEFYGIIGKPYKVWSIIQHTIDRVGDLSYTRAVAEHCIMNLPREPAHTKQFAPVVIFDRPNSPDNPDDWANSWDLSSGHGAYEYHSLPSDCKTKEFEVADQVRDQFMQKLITIPWEMGNFKDVAQHLGVALE
jgi:hypothetical protein